MTNPASSARVTLAERLSFMQLDEAARQRLRAVKPVIEREIGPALDRFYNTVRRQPQTARLFSNDQHIDRAKASQVGH